MQVDITVNSPEAGTVTSHLAPEGETIAVGQDLFTLDTDGKPGAGDAAPAPPKAEAPKAAEPAPSPAAPAPAAAPKPAAPAPAPAAAAPKPASPVVTAGPPAPAGARGENRVSFGLELDVS